METAIWDGYYLRELNIDSTHIDNLLFCGLVEDKKSQDVQETEETEQG